MASFANPSQAMSKEIDKEELIQAIRLNIAGELEAIFVYDAHVQATDDPVAKKVIADIRMRKSSCGRINDIASLP